MDKLNSIGRKEELFFKELRANLDLIFEIGDDLNKIGQTFSLIFFNQNVHDINEGDDFLNWFVNVFFDGLICLLGDSTCRWDTVWLLIDTIEALLSVVEGGKSCW